MTPAMPKITIRNVPDGLHQRLKRRADQNRRSLNSELLDILEKTVGPSTEEKRRIHDAIASNPSHSLSSTDPQTLKETYRQGLS